jgi:hypothetical protein
MAGAVSLGIALRYLAAQRRERRAARIKLALVR